MGMPSMLKTPMIRQLPGPWSIHHRRPTLRGYLEMTTSKNAGTRTDRDLEQLPTSRVPASLVVPVVSP